MEKQTGSWEMMMLKHSSDPIRILSATEKQERLLETKFPLQNFVKLNFVFARYWLTSRCTIWKSEKFVYKQYKIENKFFMNCRVVTFFHVQNFYYSAEGEKF